MKLLREIFDQPYPYTKAPHTGKTSTFMKNFHTYNFKSPHEKYSVELFHHGSDQNPEKTRAIVSFGAGSQQAINKTGNEGRGSHKVFSTVHHIIKQHLIDHPHIKQLSFGGSKEGKDTDGSRVKLYRHMVKNFAHKHTEEHSDFNVDFKVNREDLK